MDRSAARAAAMKLLYEWEMGGNGGEDTRLGLLEIKPNEEETEYMEATVSGVQQHIQEIDEKIEKYAIGWPLSRINRVDLSILRLGVYEIVYAEGVPGGVAVNEAVELAKTFSGPESGSFVNGVLGSLLRAGEQ
jgi:N utilization substance protein B